MPYVDPAKRPPQLDPGKPSRWRLPKWAGKLGWAGAGLAWASYLWPGAPGDPDGGWGYEGFTNFAWCDDPDLPGFPWQPTGFVGSITGYFPGGTPPGMACIGEQAGYGPGTFDPIPLPDWYSTPSFTVRRWMIVQTFYNPVTNAHRGWHIRSAETANYPNTASGYFVPPGTGAPNIGPNPDPGPWQAPFFPFVSKPDAVPEWHKPQPIQNPVNRPKPWSPEAPDVGPRPDPSASPSPSTQPEPQPETYPVPEGLPELLPEFTLAPVPITNISVGQAGPVARTQPNPRQKPKRPPPRTKEKKVKASGLVGFLWNAVGTVTEGIDLINAFYECLPKKVLVDAYKKLGRQPNPAERLELLYLHINKLDVGCGIMNHIENQITDMISALGSDQIAEANRNRMKPIGFEAGPALGNEYGFGNIGPIFAR